MQKARGSKATPRGTEKATCPRWAVTCVVCTPCRLGPGINKFRLSGTSDAQIPPHMHSACNEYKVLVLH